MTTSQKLEKAIRDSGLSIRDLSERTGVSRSAIQRYTSGTTEKIPIDRLEKLAQALGQDPAYFMGWDDPEAPAAPTHVSEEELKFALFGDDAQEVTDAQFEEVKRFAQFVMQRDRKK